jgi:polyisoprenoid-binding protein YceI
MGRISTLLTALAFTLAACSSQAPTPTAPPASPTGLPKPNVASSAPLNQTPAAGDQVVTYSINPEQSSLEYHVDEVLFNQNNRLNTAVGVTREIHGEVTVDRANPQKSAIGTITIDISKFTSDSGQRDNQIRRRFLESSKYPTVTIVPKSIEGLPDSIQEGQAYDLKIASDVTIRDVTRPVTFEALVGMQGDTLSGQAGVTILMSDFGFGPIDMAGILKTNDEVRLILSFTAHPLASE